VTLKEEPMKGKPFIHLVAVEYLPELESESVKWVTEVHIPMLFAFKGLKKAELYKRVYEAPEYPSYMCLYEFDSKSAFEEFDSSPELAIARKDAMERWKEGDNEIKWRVQYELMWEAGQDEP
jgi:hypothetical protein